MTVKTDMTFTSIPDVLEKRASASPEREFLYLDDHWVTYGGLLSAARRFATFALAEGLTSGDRVGIMLDNQDELLAAWFGTCRIGAIEVPLNTALRHTQLEYVLGNCDMRILVIGAEYLSRLEDISLPRALRVVVVGDTKGQTPPSRGVSWSSAVDDSSPDPEELPPLDVTLSSPAAIIYTSGTTGPSKGVVCPHGHLMALGSHTLDLLECGPGDVLYDAHPLFHAHSQGQAVLAAMLADIPLIMRRKFSASRFIEDIVEFDVTVAYLIGAAGLVLKQPDRPEFRKHKLRLVCAVPIPKGERAALEDKFGVPVIDLYGMSEMGVISSNRLNRRVDGSCGAATPFRDVQIVDEDGCPLPAGEVGEILVRSNDPWTTFREYWGMPDQTLATLQNMWFHTGDTGRMDEQGNIFFVGRIKDSIRRRGENISAFEVEQVINSHPSVLESAVLPYPSPVGEDDVWAVIVTIPGEKVLAGELAEFFEDRLPRFSKPRYLQFETALPKTPTERIEKYKLRDRGLAKDAVDLEAGTA